MKLKKLFSLIALSLFLFSCAMTQISIYDNETYKSLTYLKPDVEIVYYNYGNEELHRPSINHVIIEIRKIVEYEKWKGEPNRPTYKQVLIIQKMFDRHLKERRASETPWSRKHIQNKLSNIQETINIAIKSELSKNKEGS
jgi:hypothetical protein